MGENFHPWFEVEDERAKTRDPPDGYQTKCLSNRVSASVCVCVFVLCMKASKVRRFNKC